MDHISEPNLRNLCDMSWTCHVARIQLLALLVVKSLSKAALQVIISFYIYSSLHSQAALQVTHIYNFKSFLLSYTSCCIHRYCVVTLNNNMGFRLPGIRMSSSSKPVDEVSKWSCSWFPFYYWINLFISRII